MRNDHGYRNRPPTTPKQVKSSSFYVEGKSLGSIVKGSDKRDGATKQGKTKGKMV